MLSTPLKVLLKKTLLLACSLLMSWQVQAQSINSIMTQFRNFDMNSDGVKEINKLEYMPFERTNDGVKTSSKLVLVLVEPRLLNNISGSEYSVNDLNERLVRYKDDLRAEGYFSRFIKADVYDGTSHQDGQTVLAMRKFLQEVDDTWNLEGVVLVGQFPEAMLVRRWIWRRKAWKVNIDGTEYNCATCPKSDFLRIVPEIVADRSDIVLADLDGKWDQIYEKGPKNLEFVEAIPKAGTPTNWPTNNMTYKSDKFNVGTKSFQDFFWIKDDDYSITRNSGGQLEVLLRTAEQNPELSNADKSKTNPIAYPEIHVSRINARNIASAPDPNIKDSSGKGLLDSSGKPRTIVLPSHKEPKDFMKHSLAKEREVLIDYFDRNHDFRAGGNDATAHRTAATNFGSGLIKGSDFNTWLKKASTSYGSSLSFNDASLLEYTDFVKAKASLKGISAHSNAWNSVFGEAYSASALSSKAGTPWVWKKTSSSPHTYVPSFDNQKGNADANLHRTLYENDKMKDVGGVLYIHMGCQVNSPAGAPSKRYNDGSYASKRGFQNAESVLFHLNGVALASRAKVFYDKPEGFTDELRKSTKSHFGDGLKAYFTKERADAGIATKISSRKRTYTWSIIGDWTVRTKYDNGIGILKTSDSKFKEQIVHADKAWFHGGWNFEAAKNKVEGIGDFNGDGIDDFLLTSSWGIGIITYKNKHWQALVAKPKDTWFGKWRYNASVNTGSDKIQAIDDFDGDGKDEILITSSWGIGVLKLQGNTMTAIVAKEKGTRFSGWLYNPADNKIEGTGDFNGDRKADIVISSPWGIGLLTLSSSSFSGLVVKPKDTWFGQWRYNASVNSGKDKIQAIADFNKDGKDEILVTSSWGIGVLRLNGNSFVSVLAKENGTRFSGWLLNTKDNTIEGTGDFNGDGKDDFIIRSPWGIGIMTLSGSSFTGLMVKPKDTWFNKWRFDASVNRGKDVIRGVGDLNNDGKDDILISSSWGLGVLKLQGNSLYSISTSRYGQKAGAWRLSKSNGYPAVGNFDTSLGDEILIVK